MNFDKITVGQRIKQKRLECGFTQSDLAKQSDITRIALGNYERGERVPTIDIFARIAMALCVSIDELIGYTPTKLSLHQIAIREFEKAGYEVKESNTPFGKYEIKEQGEEYPFFVKREADIEELYQKAKKEVLQEVKMSWERNFHDVLVDYEMRERKKNFETGQYLKIKMKQLSDQMMKAEKDGDTDKMNSLTQNLMKLVQNINANGIDDSDEKK
ncbi:helix-turn-helix transcriptional regulator [Megasphaera sp.]|uniref:helix-turn-helix domain-containing protein n=1 Tax=Megasphaera sp. TaxID=2023260 RepID=UPI001D6D9FC2|nr:helix-turn-helix transcriptional regulator [Megasphaera sp.]MBS6104474.1 helix-turn-helix transcriptional regulator [Megasphaera sp.]